MDEYQVNSGSVAQGTNGQGFVQGTTKAAIETNKLFIFQ
jgi:hypothetical protein